MSTSSPIPGLSLVHYAELSCESAISDDQIRSRGYISASADMLPSAFAEYQRRDGLLIPLRTVRGEIESYQHKPGTPRLGKNKKPIKYETATNAPQVIDVPSAALPLLSDRRVPLFITEGAKKVDAAVTAGMAATIGLQGVFGWRGKGVAGGTAALADWESIALNNRLVTIAFDSDVMTKDSVRHAIDRLARFLRSRRAEVHFLLLPSLADGAKCGLDDWFALGRTVAMLQSHIVEELAPLPITSSTSSLKPVAVTMTEVESKPIDWLWPNWLPKGMLTLLGGYAGDGKSTITMNLAAAFSNGSVLPDGAPAQLTNTLLMVAEDDLSHVVKPRLEVHGANMDRVHVLQALESPDGSLRGVNLRRDINVLRQVVLERNIGLIVIDPLSSYLANGDRNSEGDVRDTLQPLVHLMEETGVAVIGIMHIGKTDGQQRAMQKLMGSTAFTALARSVWMVNNLPDDLQDASRPVRKMLGVSKSNYAIPPMPLMFSREIDGPIVFHGPSPIGIEESFRPQRSDNDSRQKQTEAIEEFVLDQLKQGDKAVSRIEAEAKREGFALHTLKRQKIKMGIKSEKRQDGWYWLQPEVA